MKQLLLTLTLFASICLQAIAQPITGLIQTETNVPVHNVEVGDVMTDINGNYEMLNPTFPLTVAPYKNDDPLNGVNVCDLIAIRNHILGIENLDSPYKIIASDLNKNNGITTFDLVEITRVLLGVESEFTTSNSWRFVDEDFVFPSPTNPFATPFPEVININNNPTAFEANFVAVKMGDVNNSALGSYPGTQVPDTDVLFFDFEDELVDAQDEFVVEFKAKDFVEGLGFQFSLNYDVNKLEFIEFSEQELATANGNIESMQVNPVNNGVLGALWIATNPTNAVTLDDGDVVFNVKFKVLDQTQLAESIMFTGDLVPIASANSQGCYGEVNSPPFTTSTNHTIASLSNIDIYPNPTNEHFNLELDLTTSKNVNIELFNLIGQDLLTKSYEGISIKDQIDISNFSNGIYFLSIEVDGEIVTKRIVKGK